MNRWDEGAFEYTDVAKLKSALVGRSILSILSEGDYEERTLSFVLDDGTVLRAHSGEGCGGCGNGWFPVNLGRQVTGTIMNVRVGEEEITYTNYPEFETEAIKPGSITDGESRIRVYVYTELEEGVLIESEGGDNGYYGWGFWLDVQGVQS